jgi:hypothetical protein
LEDGGKDVYHHTYFNVGAIDMAFELLTEVRINQKQFLRQKKMSFGIYIYGIVSAFFLRGAGEIAQSSPNDLSRRRRKNWGNFVSWSGRRKSKKTITSD